MLEIDREEGQAEKEKRIVISNTVFAPPVML